MPSWTAPGFGFEAEFIRAEGPTADIALGSDKIKDWNACCERNRTSLATGLVGKSRRPAPSGSTRQSKLDAAIVGPKDTDLGHNCSAVHPVGPG